MTASPRKLVCYDASGEKRVRLVAEPLYRQVLKLFNGELRAVHRSTGGMGLAMPVGLKFKDTTPAEVSDINAVVIVMNCMQFNPLAKTADATAISRRKLIPLSRIKDGFKIPLDGDQRCVVDFGMGLVPIRVLSYVKTGSGPEMAVFLEHPSYVKLVFGKESSTTVQPYLIPKECLRWARGAKGQPGDEMEKARQNLEKLVAAGKEPIPSILSLGDPLTLPAGSSAKELLQDRLRQFHKEQRHGEAEMTLDLSPEGLLPFGLLEMTASVIRG